MAKLRHRDRSSDILNDIKLDPLFHHLKRSQLWWFRHLARIPPFVGFPRHGKLGENEEVDPELTADIMQLTWSENILGSCRRNLEAMYDPTSDKKNIMDVWTD